MTNLQKAKPVANWRNRDEYDIKLEDFYDADILAGYSTAGEKVLLQNMIWRWEFLRRHPNYQANWQETAGNLELSGKLYGLARPAPDPLNPDKTIPILFSYTADNKSPGIMTTSVDLRYPIDSQLKLIKTAYHSIKKRLSQRIASKKFKKDYARKLPSKNKIIKALRALDAYAEDISYAQIAKTLGPSPDKEHMSQYGKEHVERAFAIQNYFTRLPEPSLQRDTTPHKSVP